MPKITNPNYRRFLDSGEINLLKNEEIDAALNKVSGIYGRHVKEGRAMLIALFLTGARPIEILNLKSKHISKEGNHVVVSLQTAKHGKARPIYLSPHKAIVKELFIYSQSMYPEMLLFYHYRSKSVSVYKTKKGEFKDYEDISDKLKYHVKKWFEGVIPDSITPYFLRHNRFSSHSSKGMPINDIMLAKGAKSIDSVYPYLHQSKELAKKNARFYN